MPELNIQSNVDRGVSVLSLRGPFRLAGASEFRKASSGLIESGVRKVVVDLSEVDELDGFGLSALVGLLARLHRLGGRMALAGVNPELKKRFEATWTEDVFRQHITVAQAATEMQKNG
ncbi:MAG: STAS domain-containing protein [Vulcanimicrobiota bacterium]